MTPDEFEAVKSVLLDRLENTEDEELQAALWQALHRFDAQERRLNRLRRGLVALLLEGISQWSE